nr:MAG TPA: Tape measure domain protein [Caudoviricetes sp.]
MASGNLGELWFNLGVNDRTSKTFNGILRTLKETDGSVSALRKKLEELKKSSSEADGFDKALRNAIKNAYDYLGMLQTINKERSKIAELKVLNKDAKDLSELERADGLLKKIKSDLMDLQKKQFNGVDVADLMPYQKALRNTINDVRTLSSAFQRDNSLSVAASNAARLKIELEKVSNKLSEIYSKQSDGLRKGYNTSYLLSAGNTLRGVKTRIGNMLGSDDLLANETKFKSLISDIAYASEKAKGKLAEYNREKSRSIELDRNSKKELAKLDQQEGRARSIAETISKVDRKIREFGETRDVSIKLAASTTNIDGAISKLSDLRSKLDVVDISSKKDVANLVSEYRILSNEIGNTKSKQDSLNRSIEALYRKNANKVTARDNSNERQRLREIDIAQKRMNSLDDTLLKLRKEFGESVRLQVDTTQIDAKIKDIENQFAYLKKIQNDLANGNLSSLGLVSNIGDGREVQLANRVADAQRAANREAQRGIELEQKRQQEIAQSAAKVQSDLVRGFERANSHAGKLNSTVQDLKSLFLQGGLVFGAQQFAMSIITTGGEMEKQHIALQSILGDMQNANTMFNQIKELALNSPFTFSELNRDVKQLAAYGVEYDQLYDTTKRLADMSSGLGVSFDRIALAFGQVQARGWLDGKELRQIAYAGIPLLDKLSKFYSKQEGRNVSTSEIKTRISNREVSFDDVKSIFWQMTDAGGQFYNMQQVLSETLLGRYNKLKDAWEIMLAEFASGDALVGKFFKTAIDGATALVQSLHTLAMPIGAIFAGYAFKKMAAGNTASSFLSNKANLASNIQNKVLQGQALTQIEQRILATKNQITGADLRALANARALTTEKLNQLRLSGKITAEQYNIYRGIVLRQTGEKTVRMQMLRTLATMRSMSLTTTLSSVKNVWTGFQASALAAFRVIGTGAKSLATGIWSAIGGLPGLIITAVTFGITYAISEYQELSQKIKQTQDEIADKNKQIRDFLRDNNVNIAISGGDTKEIDNMIDSYKEKLKELAPYSYKNMLMTAEEKKSHADRLKYLEQEIKLLKEANDIASTKLSNRGYYSDLSDATEDVIDAFKKREEMRVAAMASDASAGDKELYANEKAYDNYIESLKDKLAKKFGDIGKDEKMREAAMQAMSGIFSSMGVPEDKADIIRTSILQAFGCGDKSAWLQSEVSNSMISLIDKSFPMIGEKIKASIPLNDAEKAKVKELMNDAKNGLIRQYPELERTLQNMLAASNFQAVIRLVLDGGEKLNNLQSELVKRIPSRYSGLIMSETSGKYKAFAEKWGKEDSWYSARNSAQSDIDKAKNEYLSAKASKAKNAGELYTAWQTVKQAAKDLLYYDYEGAGKKSNKPVKNNNGGSKEDAELKRLQKRISLYKKMYAEIKKFKELYGEGALGQLANDGEFEAIFGDKKRFPISDYTNYETSIKELLKTLPASTKDRLDYAANEKAGIQTENRKLIEDQRRDELNVLNKQLDVISEQYDTYKKIYELTGNKKGSENIAFGGTVQFDTYKKFLEEQLDIAVKHDNVQSGLNLTTDEVKEMSLENVKDKYGEETRVYDIRKKLEDENNKIKKETIDLMASLIEKNATIAQQIEDENRKYERQLELIKDIEDPQMRDRAKAGATKTHNENLAKLQFEQFKQESDWVAIFDDLDRVSSATINSMIEKIDKFSMTTGLSVESIKQLRDALDKLRNESISRNPFPSVFGGVKRGNAIGKFIKEHLGGMNDDARIFVSKSEASRLGIVGGVRTKASLKNDQQSAYADSSKAISELATKMQALSAVLDPVINLFKAMGEEDSILGQIVGGASGAFSSAASTAGAFDTLGKMNGLGFLQGAGPYAAAASAALSIGGSLIKAFGADYSSYEKAKAEYDNLTSIWDSLISKKTEYMNIHWGTEATEASKEAQEMLKAEIEQTKIIAQKRLNSGSSVGSHSIWYRMWKGSYKYNGQNWRDVAGEISSKYGVQFNSMEDLLNMNADTLSEIKKNYIGLWSSMDSDFREYLEKLIQYGEKADDMIEALTEKLTGNKFSDLVSSWGDAMSTMANGYEDLLDGFEGKLKNTILNSMVENIYGDKIKALLKKTQGYAENGDNIKDSGGNVISEYTGAEYTDVKNSTENLAKQIEATRDFLKKTYGWSDNSSSSSRNSAKGITEEEADLGLSYLNAIRLDCSVIRAEQAKYYPEMSEIAKSQLTRLEMISQNTLRNAEAAERIETVVTSFNDNFNRVLVGTKLLHVK